MKKETKELQLALKVFAHKVRFYIGAYIAEMNGVDAIVFTAGVGENDAIDERDNLQRPGQPGYQA